MNDKGFKLAKAPIVEAVLDIECDLPPGQQLADMEEPAKRLFVPQYPKLTKQFIQTHEFTAKHQGPAEHSVRGGLQSFRFSHDDGRQLVQVRAQGFSFNRLAPYTTLDDYMSEIERCWGLYRDLAAPILVKEVRLRYINRILLPLTGGRVDLDLYLKVGPRLPDEGRLTLAGFMHQLVAVEAGTGNRVTTVLMAQEPQGENRPLILDNTAVANGPGDPADWAWVSSKIMALRTLKNEVFRRSLTEACLNLFQ